MGDFVREIENQKELIEATLKALRVALKDKKSNVVVLGIATYVHNIYSGIENILKQILIAKGVDFDKRSPRWHQELLIISVNEKIISETLRVDLKKYLGFRHLFVHAYGVTIEYDEFKTLAKDADKVWEKFYAEIESILIDLSKS